MNYPLRYILPFSFLTLLLVIVLLQTNSNRSMNLLIDGNENLLDELNIKNDIQQLQTGIITLESKVRGSVIEGRPVNQEFFENEIHTIQSSLQKLAPLASDSMIRPGIIELNKLVQRKILFNREVLDTLSIAGKLAAERMINASTGKVLTDSIKSSCIQIDDLHALFVTQLINEADSNGIRAKILGNIMAVIAAMASVFTFGYIIYKVREQHRLIARLNESEKNARDAARIKENFLANMSHEIRTPLNAILGYTGLLQKKPLEAESQKFVKTINNAGENLLSIVNDILDISKLESGMMRIENVPFSIRGLIHSVEVMFREKAGEKGIRLVATVDPELPDLLEGDPTRLTQILVNLVGNALKFTEQGSIRIECVADGIYDGMVKTGISVSDTGVGIPRDQIPFIFERFHQGEESVTRKYGGTGLGLSIVRDLVLLQNGNVEVQSEPDKGSSFCIKIPYRVSSESHAAPNIPPAYKEEPGKMYGLRILAVEDNEINQNLVRHLLQSWEISVDIAANGNEAISLIRNQHYDLVLMDIQMPGMDGYTATHEIRETLKLKVPIIAMTAHALPGEREKCLGHGMNGYLSKPIREEELKNLIMQFTGQKFPAAANENREKLGNGHNFQWIDLTYMQEISGGNLAYEKAVTRQFIHAIPEALQELDHAMYQHDMVTLKKVAHNLRTTVSIMGMNNLLQDDLDAIEKAVDDIHPLKKHIHNITAACEGSIAEAEQYYAFISSGNGRI